MAHHRRQQRFGRELTTQLLERGDHVVGTVRRMDTVADFTEQYPDTFHVELLNVTDITAIRDVVNRSFEELRRIDVIVSNAGYGLFGAAEELSDGQIDGIIATKPGRIDPADPRRAASPASPRRWAHHPALLLWRAGGIPRQLSLYHATKWGIEGFVESIEQEVAGFGIGMTLVEPGGARTEFRCGSAQVAEQMPEYDDILARAPLRMLDPACGLPPATPHAWQLR